MTTASPHSFVVEETSESSTPGKHEPASAKPDLVQAFLEQYLAMHDEKDVPTCPDGTPDVQRIMHSVLNAMNAGKSSTAVHVEAPPTSLPSIAEASIFRAR